MCTSATGRACWALACDVPVPARKDWPSGLRALVARKSNNPHGAHHCWHCGEPLRRGWHMDHHPKPWRDIHDQLCCGVTDEHDLENLVPSCPSCNTSHTHEPNGHPCYCGRTQCCCLRSVARRAMWLACGLLLGALITAVAFAAAQAK